MPNPRPRSSHRRIARTAGGVPFVVESRPTFPDHRPWLVKGHMREGQGMFIRAGIPEIMSEMATSLAYCLALGTPYLGLQPPERTCGVAYFSPTVPQHPPCGIPSPRSRPLHHVAGRPLLDLDEERAAVADHIRELQVEVAIFDPTSFSRALPEDEQERHLVLAGNACLAAGALPVFLVRVV